MANRIRPKRAKATIAAVALLGLLAAATPTLAEAAKLSTGLPVPRFVTLKAKKINLRVGPGQDYAVSWRYLKAGVPVEITQEYENWRRIRDAEGAEGWVFHSLLSGERAAIAAPWMREKGPDIFVNMRTDARDSGHVIAKLQPGVVVKLDQCNGQWCHAEAKDVEGWVSQAEIWGAYPGEAFTK
ncbi:MAG: SH3 domain-containing protein [Rhizobium sp.]|nr:SH3 domain-containing protein [Rhizobium sp.]